MTRPSVAMTHGMSVNMAIQAAAFRTVFNPKTKTGGFHSTSTCEFSERGEEFGTVRGQLLDLTPNQPPTNRSGLFGIGPDRSCEAPGVRLQAGCIDGMPLTRRDSATFLRVANWSVFLRTCAWIQSSHPTEVDSDLN